MPIPKIHPIRKAERTYGADMKMETAIFVIGPNRLQNELLATYIQEASGIGCQCCATIETPLILRLNKVLLLLDSLQDSLSALCNEPDVQSFLSLPNQMLAFFNASPDGNGERELLKHGVRGIFYKSDPPQRIAKGTQAILDGDLWFRRKIISEYLIEGILAGEQAPPGEAPAVPLTEREREILRRVASGQSNKAIARSLCISHHTVKTHLYRIFKKISVPNRFQAALWAAKHLAF